MNGAFGSLRADSTDFFSQSSPPVESAHRRPNPCSEPRAIPLLRNQVTELDSIERPIEWEGITPTNNKVSSASFVHGSAN